MDLTSNLLDMKVDPPLDLDLGSMNCDLDFTTPDLEMSSALDLTLMSPKCEGPDTPPLTPQRPSFPGCAISSLQQNQVAVNGTVVSGNVLNGSNLMVHGKLSF